MGALLSLLLFLAPRAHFGIDYGFVLSSPDMRGGSHAAFSLAQPVGKGWFLGAAIEASKYISLGEGDYRVNFLGGGLYLEGRPFGALWKSFWIAFDIDFSRLERRRNLGKETELGFVFGVNPYFVVISTPGASFTLETSGTFAPGRKHIWTTLGLGVGVVFQWPIGPGQK